MRTPTKNPQGKKAGSKGFSFVEMLVTVCVLGIMSGIVVANISTDDSARNIKNQSNAQEIAALCGQAQAAGLDFVVPNDLTKTIKNVIAGGSPTGMLHTMTFSLPQLACADVEGASHYLKISHGQLCYTGAGL